MLEYVRVTIAALAMSAMACARDGFVDNDDSTGDYDILEQDDVAAVVVADFVSTWVTPNQIRWQWTPSGNGAQLVGYELVIATSESDVTSVGASAIVVTPSTAPEVSRSTIASARTTPAPVGSVLLFAEEEPGGYSLPEGPTAPGWWGEVWIGLGNGCSEDCIAEYTALTIPNGDYVLIQIPLRMFTTNVGPLTSAQLVTQGLMGFRVGSAWLDAAVIRVDEVRLRW